MDISKTAWINAREGERCEDDQPDTGERYGVSP